MRIAEFEWGALSRRQMIVLSWWMDGSGYDDYDGIIADGAIRSGKTVSMAFSFVLWATARFNGQNFAMCGKTIASLRRNCIVTLRRQLLARGFEAHERKSENLLEVTWQGHTNYFYFFGGKDESSQDLIQGITLAGAFFDEVALMPESFVNQATARCSVTGSKYWFNCNPASPQHWFRQNWLLKVKERNILYLHFTMDDNLTLNDRIKDRYAAQYTGVFYQRFIEGKWVMADGVVYDMFDEEQHTCATAPETEGDYYVSSDFGIQNATTFLLWRKQKGTERWVCLREYYYSGRESKRQASVSDLADGLEQMLGGIEPKRVFIDPSAAALIVECRRRGYHCQSANNDVLDGIATVATLLRGNRLLFDKSCRHTIGEFGAYAWDENAAKRGEDKPIKENDHCMDAVRYFVMTKKLSMRDGSNGYKSIL